MCGQEGLFGTAAFQVVLDINEMINLEEKYKYEYEDNEQIIEDALFKDLSNDLGKCSLDALKMDMHVDNIKAEDLGKMNDYDPFA